MAIAGKDKDALVAALIAQLTADHKIAVRTEQAGTALAATKAIAALLGLPIEASAASAEPVINVTIDRDLAKVIRTHDEVIQPPEPSAAEVELAQRLLALLESKQP